MHLGKRVFVNLLCKLKTEVTFALQLIPEIKTAPQKLLYETLQQKRL